MGYVFLPPPVRFRRNRTQSGLYIEDPIQVTVDQDPEFGGSSDSYWPHATVGMYDAHFNTIFNYHNDIRFFNGLDDWDFHVYLSKTQRLPFCKKEHFTFPIGQFFSLGFNDYTLAVMETVPFPVSTARFYWVGVGGKPYGFGNQHFQHHQSPWICRPVGFPNDFKVKRFDAVPGIPTEIEVHGIKGNMSPIWESIVFYTRMNAGGRARHFIGVSERFDTAVYTENQRQYFIPYLDPSRSGGEDQWRYYGNGDFFGGYHGSTEGRSAYLTEVDISDEPQEIPVYTIDGQYAGKTMSITINAAPENGAALFFVGFRQLKGERRWFWRLTEDPDYPIESGSIGDDPHMPQTAGFLAETLSTEVLPDFTFIQNDPELHPIYSYRDVAYPMNGDVGTYDYGIDPDMASTITLPPLTKYLVFGPEGSSQVRVRPRHGPTEVGHWAARKVEFYTGEKSEFMFDGPYGAGFSGVAHTKGVACNFTDYFREARECIVDMIDRGCLTMAGQDYGLTKKATVIRSLHEYLDWKYSEGRFWNVTSQADEVPFPSRSIPIPPEEPEEDPEVEVTWAESLEEMGSRLYYQEGIAPWVGGTGKIGRHIFGPQDISFDELYPLNVSDGHIRMYVSADYKALRFLDPTLRDFPENINLASTMVDSVISKLNTLLAGKEDVYIALWMHEPWSEEFNKSFTHARTTWSSGIIQEKLRNFWGYQKPGDPDNIYPYFWYWATPYHDLHDALAVRGLTWNDEVTVEIPYNIYGGECYSIGVTPVAWVSDTSESGSGHWGIDVPNDGYYNSFYTHGTQDRVRTAKEVGLKHFCLYRYWAGDAYRTQIEENCLETGGEAFTV